jgi:hypothetical protein
MAGLDVTPAQPVGDEQSDVRRAQATSYVRQTPINSVAAIVAASFQVYALWPVAPRAWVVAWYAVVTLIALAMLASWNSERRRPTRAQISPRLVTRATCGWRSPARSRAAPPCS